MAPPEQLAYVVDETRWPLLVLRATSAVNDVAALDATYRAMERVLQKRTRFLLLFDLRAGGSSPSRRRRLLDWGLQHQEELESFVEAQAIVVGTSIERGFVTAMLWLTPMHWPVRVFASAEEAEHWLTSER